jgi:hypothetical protein
MREVEAIATLEGQWQPVALYHLARGLRWQVREVLGGWTHPDWPGKTYQKPVAQKRYRLRVLLATNALQASTHPDGRPKYPEDGSLPSY